MTDEYVREMFGSCPPGYVFRSEDMLGALLDTGLFTHVRDYQDYSRLELTYHGRTHDGRAVRIGTVPYAVAYRVCTQEEVVQLAERMVVWLRTELEGKETGEG